MRQFLLLRLRISSIYVVEGKTIRKGGNGVSSHETDCCSQLKLLQAEMAVPYATQCILYITSVRNNLNSVFTPPSNVSTAINRTKTAIISYEVLRLLLSLRCIRCYQKQNWTHNIHARPHR